MVSKRNLFSMVLVMAVILFMFQFSQILKENSRDYKTNPYARPWLHSQEAKVVTENELDEKWVLLIGSKEREETRMVAQWCTFQKYPLKVALSPSAYMDNPPEQDPFLILVDGAYRGENGITADIARLARKGIPVCYITLPSVQALQKDSELRELLGISEIRTSQIILSEEMLFDGFLLGGAMDYKDSRDSAVRLNDFHLSIPWIITGEGTKPYMVGTVEGREMKESERPRVLWRNRYRNSMVFAINGDFAKDECLYGILSGFLYECQEYTLYPVVNGQNVIVKNFPTFTYENEEVLMELYSRNSKAVEDEILWPELYALSVKHHFKPTIFLSTKYDYDDSQTPSADRLNFYLQQIAEAQGEAGRSLSYKGGSSFAGKAMADYFFYQKEQCPYTFSSGYVIDFDPKLRRALGDCEGLKDIQTLTGLKSDKEPVIGYFEKGVTKQCITTDIQDYTYREDFRTRCLLTGLGYSNLSIDFHSMIWPKNEEDQIQNYFGRMVAFMDAYWSKLMLLEQTTLSQSDARVRTLLGISYTSKLEGDVISLETSDIKEPAYFLLRTHGKVVDRVIGGSAKKVEEDAYLIKIVSNKVQITLGESDSIFHFRSPVSFFK